MSVTHMVRVNAIPYYDLQDTPYATVCDQCGKELYKFEVREGELGKTLCLECEEEKYG